MAAQSGGDVANQTTAGERCRKRVGEVKASPRLQNPDGEGLILRRSGAALRSWCSQRRAARGAGPRSSSCRERDPTLRGRVSQLGDGAAARDRTDITILLAGLGMGYTLSAILASQRVIRVDVVEHPPRSSNGTAAICRRCTTNRHSLIRVCTFTRWAFPTICARHALRHHPRPHARRGGYLGVVVDLDHGPSKLPPAAECGPVRTPTRACKISKTRCSRRRPGHVVRAARARASLSHAWGLASRTSPRSPIQSTSRAAPASTTCTGSRRANAARPKAQA